MWNQKEEAKANTVSGILTSFTSFISFLEHRTYFTQNKDQWVIDTGATTHMCMSHIILAENQKLPSPISVRVSTNESTKAYYIGQIASNDKIKLKDVLKLHSFDVNLISITKLTKDLNYSDIFYHDYCIIPDN